MEGILYWFMSFSIITLVPTSMYLINSAISSLFMRIHPSELLVPIDSGKHVPWIPIPDHREVLKRIK